jgi:hypothetical protein
MMLSRVEGVDQVLRKTSHPARRLYRRRQRQLSFEHLERRWTPSVDVLTYHFDNALDGQNTAETTLTPSNVNSTSFGKLFTLPTDGYVYAQPLLKTGVIIAGVPHDVLFVATEHDSVYAFDAQGNNPAQGYLWKDSFVNPDQGVTTVPSGDVGVDDIVPEIGITGTPVIDPSTNTLYVVAKTKEVSGSTTTYVQRLHALDLATGAEKFNGPVVIQASVPGTGDGGSVSSDVVSATGQTISLPAGSYTSLQFLATGVNGNQTDQTFAVTYTDGTTTTFTQSISDWYTPQNYPGESTAVTMGYRDNYDGTMDSRTFDVYGYQFSLDPTKTVSSITLPNDANVELLSVTLSSAAGTTMVPLGSSFNLAGIVNDGSTFSSSGGLDGDGSALSANLLGTSQTWNGTPFTIGAPAASGASTASFDALLENQRAALALVNGNVYIAWASHGDLGAYHGWVLGYNATTLTQVGVFNSTPNGSEGGIWMSGGGIAADSSNNLYLSVGNGTFDANTTGGIDYGDSAVKLDTNSGLSVSDSFTPYNQDYLSNTDTDFGVADVLLLPDQSGSHPHEAITADKGGTLYLLDRDNMGGYNTTSNNDVGAASIGTPLHNSLAYFNGSVYVAGDGGPLQAYALSNGTLSADPTASSATTFGSANGSGGSGTNPIISANGPNDPNGIVWALDNSGYSTSSPAVLYAYKASDLSELYDSTQAANSRDQAGAAVKFSAPVVANELVYVPGESSVTVYGLLAPPTTVASTPVDLSPSFNLTGIVNDGATFPAAGGLDGNGSALSSNLLGSGLTWAGTHFALGPAGSSDVVSATGQTIGLPAGSYTSLQFLATGVNGNQTDQTFTVTYTDGTTTTFTQSISDWYTPQNYPGESTAVTMGYRDNYDGTMGSRIFDVYGYSFPLDPTKTVSGITLPDNPNVEVLGIAMFP